MIIMAISSIEDPDNQRFIENLYEEHKRLMLSKVGKYISDPNDRADVIQEVLIKLIEKISDLRGKKSCVLRAYIVSVIRSTSIDYLRRQRVRLSHTLPLETVEEMHVASLDDLMELVENKSCLSRIWPQISEDDQLLLEMRYIQGYSHAELASYLKCTEANARMKLTRARRRVLQLLQESEG